MHKYIPLMQGVADKLVAAEGSLDVATSDAAALLEQMISARKEANVSMVVDAKAHAKVVAALSALTAARSAMAEAHNEMNEVKLRLGVRTKLTASDKQVRGEDESRVELRVVGE
jgi:hypothetical protein